MEQNAKATAFRRMHLEPPILVLPNAWDVASAGALAALKGCRALATSSAAVARSLGWEDGERAPAAEMVEAARRIAAAVEVPVTADLERGYGDPVGTAQAAWEAGLVGINVEDSTRAGLVELDEQVETIAAIRAAVPELVINARVDVFLGIGRGDVDIAVERANAYLCAGADCTYPILAPVVSIAVLARRIDGPMNVLVQKGTPEPPELQALGVARLTWGGGLAEIAYDEAARVAAAALSL
ncbi:MAG TPA: isocitrate lyase/phosphoenolpyruvate mutase family protein [Gaiellaceae bacterium]|nr:isocitrate lyase/phosphoenolpyruvate mutase family protein [Gaiellaceae bacterium]